MKKNSNNIIVYMNLFLGVMFVFSAASKAWDMQSFAIQISYYGIIKQETAVTSIAYFLTAFETILGIAILTGFSFYKWLYRFVVVLLILFSLVLMYGWIFIGLEDCGCFGSLIALSPEISIVKNIVLISGTLWILYSTAISNTLWSSELTLFSANLHKAVVAIFCLLILTPGMFISHDSSNSVEEPSFQIVEASSSDSPYSQYQFSNDDQLYQLDKGIFLLALLSDSCHHCEASVAHLNLLTRELQSDIPIISLCLGEEETLKQFREKTQPEFPTFLIPPLSFFELIGSSPPRFSLIQDGEALSHWDEEVPTLEEIFLTLEKR